MARRRSQEVMEPQAHWESFGQETKKNSFDNPVQGLPENGGEFALEPGTIMTITDTTGVHQVELTESMNVTIGRPDREIEKHRANGDAKILAFNKKLVHVIRDRREVSVDYRPIGYVYGTETYHSETYPDD